jgi:dihydrolipoamide dehydrogenase
MSEAKTYDVLVLGGGPGGYTAAFRAADLGLAVCLVEKEERLGGVCLNVGCIPSKTLLHAAAVIEEAAGAGDFGIDFAPPKVDLERLREKECGHRSADRGLDGLCKARKITRVTGKGRFKDRLHSPCIREWRRDQEVKFANAVIATGSHPFVLPNIPDDPRIWDSTAALQLSTVPGRLLIIGGGIIGLEMAQIYSALGSEITIVEMLDQIIPAGGQGSHPAALSQAEETLYHSHQDQGHKDFPDSGIQVKHRGGQSRRRCRIRRGAGGGRPAAQYR